MNTANPLNNRIALVTGASRGIGRAIALELARAGAWVAINYRSDEAGARQVVEAVRAMGREAVMLRADISRKDQARALVGQVAEHWGRLDVLVNNAAITRDHTLRKLTDEDWEAVVETNLNGVYYTVSAALPGMIARHFGRIVNISAFVGQAGNFGQANYAAAKGGLIAFTKSAALELAKNNITVNAVAPGFTETDMLAQVEPRMQQHIIARIPMGRFGRPEEVARAVRFLAAEGDYITGQQLNVNGGVYM